MCEYVYIQKIFGTSLINRFELVARRALTDEANKLVVQAGDPTGGANSPVVLDLMGSLNKK